MAIFQGIIQAMAKNIEAAGPECLAWNCSDAAASLKDLLNYVEDEANKSMNWYWERKKWKARFSRGIQFNGVVLAAAAGILPIIGELTGWRVLRDGLWATLLVGLAAALIGLDKAFGYSSGWARYVLTATSIRKALEEFRMDRLAIAAKACPAPNSEQIGALIRRSKDFRLTVESLVFQETKDWVTEFQTNFAQLEKDVQSRLDKLRAEAAIPAGSVEIALPNSDKADNAEVQVYLEGADGKVADEVLRGSKAWVRLGLKPGHYRVTIRAKAAGKPIETTAAVIVNPGEVAKAAVSLPL
jgi:hypothetical protein